MTDLEILRQQTSTLLKVIENEQKNRELAEQANDTANEAIRLAIEAKQDVTHACDYCALATYASSRGILLTTADASRHGMAMTKRCKEKGIIVGSTPHERWERINTYPRIEMDAYFEEFFS